jgi:putative transposase
MIRAIKIRLYPDNEQMTYINKLIGSCRFIYNNCLAYKIEQYNRDKTSIGLGKMGKYIVQLKKQPEFYWLNEVHSKVLQQSILNLDTAYKNFFRNGTGFPKFKSKRDSKQTCRFPIDAIGKIKGNRINIILPLKNIHFKCSKTDETYLNTHQNLIKSATLTKTKSGKYYFSILIERPITKKLPTTDNLVGIDMGIKEFVITSDGETFENLKLKRNNQRKLSKLHRNLSKKENGSNNKEKCRIQLSKYYEKLNNKKENHLHKVSNLLIYENQVIIMEMLNVKGMMKNHKLSKSIQELSLFRFKEMLRYKSNWYDKTLIEVDRFFPSSKLCNKCKRKNDTLKLSERNWKCKNCGEYHNRDLNAAKNILDEGVRILSIQETKLK